MLIFFNKKDMYQTHYLEFREEKEDAEKKAQEIVDNFEKSLNELGNFMDAAEVHYGDSHKKEEYVIVKGDKKLILSIKGNGYDGGWMTSRIEEM